MGETRRKICVGQFAGAHGVRGLVRLRSFTEDPEAVFSYEPLLSSGGDRVFKVERKSVAKDHYIVAVEGVGSKEAADQLRGDKIYIPRDVLPPTAQNQYYEADLIGLSVLDADGNERGKVMGVFDYGAGAFLEIGLTRKDSFMLPFKDAFVPEVDLDAGVVRIVMPGEAE